MFRRTALKPSVVLDCFPKRGFDYNKINKFYGFEIPCRNNRRSAIETHDLTPKKSDFRAGFFSMRVVLSETKLTRPILTDSR